jgi:hypothetical protein
MKLKISKQQLNQIIKEEAIRIKTERLMNESAAQKLALYESKLAKIDQEMKRIYQGERLDEEVTEFLGIQEAELEEYFGLSKFEKAKKAYKEMKGGQVEQLRKAYKSYSPEYVDLSRALLATLQNDAIQLAKEFNITGGDIGVLRKDLLGLIQPMDYATFSNQAKKGRPGLRDIARGTTGLTLGK